MFQPEIGMSERYAKDILAGCVKPEFVKEFRELGRSVGYKNLGKLLATLTVEDITGEAEPSGDTAADDEARDRQACELEALAEAHAYDPYVNAQWFTWYRTTSGFRKTEHITRYLHTGANGSGSRKRVVEPIWSIIDRDIQALGVTYDEWRVKVGQAIARQARIQDLRQSLRQAA